MIREPMQLSVKMKDDTWLACVVNLPEGQALHPKTLTWFPVILVMGEYYEA